MSFGHSRPKMKFSLFIVLVAVIIDSALAYWDDPPNGLNLTCQICEYRNDRCDGSEEEICDSPTSPCHNTRQIDSVIRSVQARLHQLATPPPPPVQMSGQFYSSPRPKYICIKIEDEDAEKFDYIPNNAPGGRGFVDAYGRQSPRAISIVGRPRPGDEPGVAGISNFPGGNPMGPGMAPPNGGTGSGDGDPGSAMTPFAARAARARMKIMQQQKEGATVSPACDATSMNSAACDPDRVKADADTGVAAPADGDMSGTELRFKGNFVLLLSAGIFVAI